MHMCVCAFTYSHTNTCKCPALPLHVPSTKLQSKRAQIPDKAGHFIQTSPGIGVSGTVVPSIPAQNH